MRQVVHLLDNGRHGSFSSMVWHQPSILTGSTDAAISSIEVVAVSEGLAGYACIPYANKSDILLCMLLYDCQQTLQES